MLRRAVVLTLVLGSLAGTAAAEEAAPLAPVQSLAPLPAAPLPQATHEHRSPGMMTAGIVLTSVGTVFLVAGGVTAGIASGASSDNVQISAAITSIVLIPASVLFAAVGIPLWVLGARAPSATSPATATALRWTF